MARKIIFETKTAKSYIDENKIFEQFTNQYEILEKFNLQPNVEFYGYINTFPLLIKMDINNWLKYKIDLFGLNPVFFLI